MSYMLGRNVACFLIYARITRASKNSWGKVQGWLDPYSYQNKVANMEMKDRRSPLDKIFALTLFVKKQN